LTRAWRTSGASAAALLEDACRRRRPRRAAASRDMSVAANVVCDGLALISAAEADGGDHGPRAWSRHRGRERAPATQPRSRSGDSATVASASFMCLGLLFLIVLPQVRGDFLAPSLHLMAGSFLPCQQTWGLPLATVDQGEKEGRRCLLSPTSKAAGQAPVMEVDRGIVVRVYIG